MEALKDFYTVKELAALLNILPDSVRVYIRRGTIKATKLNGSYIISKDEAEKILTKQNG